MRFILPLLIALLGSAGGVNAENKIMPRELAELAEKNGCGQIDDYFERRPGMVDPPYAYGYISGPKENSAAFWCQTLGDGQRRFFLLLMERPGPGEPAADLKSGRHELGKCPHRIESANYPRGVVIIRDPRATLEDFVYLEDPRRNGPRNARMIHNGILNSYDGVEELFYCHEGKWLIRQRH